MTRRNSLFGSWWRSKAGARLEEDGTICLAGGAADLEWYNPLRLPDAPQARTQDDLWDASPVQALVLVETFGDAVRFAARWGPLGLWAVPGFEHLAAHVEIPGPGGWELGFREDAGGILLAAEEVRGVQAEGRRTELLQLVNQALAACKTYADGKGRMCFAYPSLWHAICVSLIRDMGEPWRWRTCQNRNCGKLFRADRANKLYCSSVCQIRAKRNRAYWRGKIGESVE